MTTPAVLPSFALRLPLRWALCLLPCLAALSACQGRQDLSASGCLPLRAPAGVVLAQDAGLYALRDSGMPVLLAHPRDTRNDRFQGLQLVRSLPAGTRMQVERLSQQHGFDAGKGRIRAFGRLSSGERFEYGWGAGNTIGRAPWEPADVGPLRTVSCAD